MCVCLNGNAASRLQAGSQNPPVDRGAFPSSHGVAILKGDWRGLPSVPREEAHPLGRPNKASRSLKPGRGVVWGGVSHLFEVQLLQAR